MSCKITLAVSCVLVVFAVTAAQIVPVNIVTPSIIAPEARAFRTIPVPAVTADFYAHPRYQYGYGISDRTTGDLKTASEHRDGVAVRGQYSLREPDGSFRRVTYIADHNGFRASVQRTPEARGVAVGPTIVPLVRPAIVQVAAPAIIRR